jgi:hypothetical protein
LMPLELMPLAISHITPLLIIITPLRQPFWHYATYWHIARHWRHYAIIDIADIIIDIDIIDYWLLIIDTLIIDIDAIIDY